MLPTGEQTVEVVGAILILAAYGLAQFRGLNRHGAPYLLLNAVGSGILGVIAVVHAQWGFLLLYAVWVAVAMRDLWPVLRERASP